MVEKLWVRRSNAIRNIKHAADRVIIKITTLYKCRVYSRYQVKRERERGNTLLYADLKILFSEIKYKKIVSVVIER
jgi:hypothetical protein